MAKSQLALVAAVRGTMNPLQLFIMGRGAVTIWNYLSARKSLVSLFLGFCYSTYLLTAYWSSKTQIKINTRIRILIYA